MAVTGSGEIKLIGDVNNEINGNTTDTNVSLTTLSTGAGKDAPHGLTEFYGYVDAVAPSMGSNSTHTIGETYFYSVSSVSSDGGGTITERGFYFGTSTNRASNTKYTVSGTTGSMSRANTGLSAGTTYYWWAYATNSAGTTYTSMYTQATNSPSASGLFSNMSTWGSWSPASGSAPSNCASASLTWGASMTAGGYWKTNSTTVTASWWLTSQTGNTCNTPSYGAMYGTTVSIYGNWTWGPSGSGGCGYRIESWAASGYATYHIYRSTICC